MNRTLFDRPKLRVTTFAHSDDCELGRFGGGWHWGFGFRLCKKANRNHGCPLLELLTFTLRIGWGLQS